MGYNIILADNVKEIRLGYEGENKTSKVVFTTSIKKCLETFGTGGVFSLACVNRSTPNGFPVTVTLNANNELEWVVLAEHIDIGYGSCQWTYTINGTDVEKSGKYTIRGNDSIGSGSTPPAYTSWVATVEGYKNTCVEKAEEVEEALDDYTKTEDLSAVALSGSYNDLTNKPTIPDVTNYYTKTETNTLLGGKANVGASYTKAEENALLDAKADTEDIPTKTSDLTNDSGFLTEHQSLSAYRTSADQDLIDETKASASDLTSLGGRVDTAEADIDDIEELIPSQATEQNQLADKNFVNSSIATETAHYISNNGEPFTSVAQLEAYSGTVTNNDYAFVSGTDEQGNAYYDRYKASVSGSTVTWAKEYRLNNSSFTAQQWSAIQSGITSSDVALIGTAIQPTNYAGESVSGIVKAKQSYGIGCNGTNGELWCRPLELSTYNNATTSAFISKGTLENIREDLVSRSLQSNSQIDTATKKTAIQNTIGITTETWTFTLSDNTTVTKSVKVGV